jgi:GrpB-like predicted nucleotidyltransferase (UPF0157 family)
MATHPLWRPYSSSANAVRQGGRIAHRQVQPGPLQEHREDWAEQYQALRQLIEDTIPEQVLTICHVGSTAVPALPAKPVIDIDLTVPVVEKEADYLPPLEAVGFRLIFRDDFGGDAHRQLTFGAPNANLHVWSPDAVEPRRHALFISWLRTHCRHVFWSRRGRRTWRHWDRWDGGTCAGQRARALLSSKATDLVMLWSGSASMR